MVTLAGAALSGSAAGNYSLTAVGADTADITAKSVSPRIVAGDKVYDGNTTASLSSQTVTGVIAPDVVTLGVSAASFDTKNVGVGKTVTATGLSLGGADAGNYVLRAVSATDLANITAKPVTPAVVANYKVHDGTTNASLSSLTLTGVVAPDVVTLTNSAASFASATVGANKTVTASGLGLTGAQACNYTLSAVTATDLADITAKPVTPAVEANNKVYDGTTNASLTMR